MGDVLSQDSTLVVVLELPVGGTCLLLLAIAGIISEGDQSRVVSSGMLRLNQKQSEVVKLL